MGRYTLVNLKRDVEDQAPKFGYSPQVESRFARLPLELENSGLSYFRFAPGFRLPFGHKHGEQEEVYLVIDGSMKLKLENEIVELERWDALRVAPEVMRGLEAGPDGVEIVAFGAPNTENKDAEMAMGWWAD